MLSTEGSIDYFLSFLAILCCLLCVPSAGISECILGPYPANVRLGDETLCARMLRHLERRWVQAGDTGRRGQPTYAWHCTSSRDQAFSIEIDKEHVNAILGSLGVPKHKIVKGIPHSCGILGCGLSHALAVAECIDSNATTCAIFEDDFELVRDPEEAKIAVERFFQSEPPSWEVLMRIEREKGFPKGCVEDRKRERIVC